MTLMIIGALLYVWAGLGIRQWALKYSRVELMMGGWPLVLLWPCWPLGWL